MVADPRLTNLLGATLGEAATTKIARNRNAQGFPENKKVARTGGEVAGKAREDLEAKSGRKVVSSENYLSLTQGGKKEKHLTQASPKKRSKKK